MRVLSLGGRAHAGKMAKTLGVRQDSVSRLEQRSDLLLCTLRKTVEAMGGNLSLAAKFPDRAPVALSASPNMTQGQSRDAGEVPPKICFRVGPAGPTLAER